MRIVDRSTFLAMPAGTLFAKWAPDFYSGMGIKEATLGNDFVVQPLDSFYFEGFTQNSLVQSDMLDRLAESGEESPPLCLDFCGRDGMFDRDQLFAVFSADDVRAIIARLAATLA